MAVYQAFIYTHAHLLLKELYEKFNEILIKIQCSSWKRIGNIVDKMFAIFFSLQCFIAIIKSPQSGVTLCFQFVSVSATAAAMTFVSHVKTVWAGA